MDYKWIQCFLGHWGEERGRAGTWNIGIMGTYCIMLC